MKIFGINITGRSAERPGIKDAPVEVKKIGMPEIIPPALISSVKNPGLTYQVERGWGRGLFIPPEYDLAQIGRIEDTDGYVRQAFKKKIGLLMKEGFDFVGKNPRTVHYIKTRLAQIAKASDVPTEQLIRNVAAGLIKRSNHFLIKVKNTKASGGRTWVGADGKKHTPVAGYFVIPSETMEVDADGYGNIRKWRQRMPRGFIKYYDPEDIIHFKFDVKDGFIFGTPQIVPVIDDLRSLRKIEENIELLIYQHLFPLFHYTVGTETAPAGVTESGKHEIEIVRKEIQFMPTEGGIVTPERHKIEMIGSEGRALNADSYIEHFKKRVFTGLGVSAVDMGEGETANRSTALTMSRALTDDVKDYQAVLESQFNHNIIQELLLESTFGEEVLNEENNVHLKFFEIDIDKRVKVEEHASKMFIANGITMSEFRESLGKEPILIPDDPEGSTPEEYPEWFNTYWKLFDEPKVLIQATKNKPNSPTALAAADHPSTGLTGEHVKKASETEKENQIEIEKQRAKNKPKPAGPVKKKKKAIRDNWLDDFYSELEDNILFNAKNEIKNLSYDAAIIRAQASRMSKTIKDKCVLSYLRGYSKYESNPPTFGRLPYVSSLFESRAAKYVGRLSTSLIDALTRNIDSHDPNDRISIVRSVFSSLKYRTELIVDVEERSAFNYGILHALEARGIKKIAYEVNDDCPKCSEYKNAVVSTSNINLDDIPPFHGNCECEFKPINEV